MKSATRFLIFRTGAAVVCGAGTFCLIYHLTFYSLWRFFFGEEVWPWPQWSLILLVAIPAAAAVLVGGFLIVAAPSRKNGWIAGTVGALSLFGLLRYATEVWKVMIELGFRP